MQTIVLASNNKHKIKEFKDMYPTSKILSLADIGYNEDIEETGETFLENVNIKAKTIVNFLKEKGVADVAVMADDSGLCVEALGGAPGVYSARYAGGHGNDAMNRKKILKELEREKNRKAYFVCVLVKYFPDGSCISAEGRTYGTILKDERGDKSFGYDCLFYSDELGKSFGEATPDEKNGVSHRGRAIKTLKEKEAGLGINRENH